MNVISVDIGTSSVRACFVDQYLRIRHQVSKQITLDTDTSGKAELNAVEIYHKTLTCIKEVLSWIDDHKTGVEAVSFSNASASLVCLDSDFRPIRPALTYADLRASKESRDIIRKFGKSAFHHTAAPMHASYWLPKFLWLKNQILNLNNIPFFCSIKDWVIFKLTGDFVTDDCNAAANGMIDVSNRDWDNLSLRIAGIKKNQLPEIFPTTSLLEMKRDIWKTISKNRSKPQIVLGAMDGILASLGAGAYNPGQVTTSIGSSGACRIVANSPLVDKEELRIWSYPLVSDIWVRGGAMNNGGLVTQWLVENFSQSRTSEEEAYREMFTITSNISPGAEGLLFLPYLFGERAPIYNERARGVFFGLHNTHERGHFARAGLEGILFALFSIYEILRSSENRSGEIRATGGYLQSPLMLQMQADIFGQPILVPPEGEGSIIGAAALAQLALGEISSFNALEDKFMAKEEILPNLATHEKYQSIYPRFKELYERLATLF